MRKAAHLAAVFWINAVVGYVKVLDLAGNLNLVVCRVEQSDFFNAAFSGLDSFPSVVDIVSKRSHRSKSSYDHAPFCHTVPHKNKVILV